MDELKLPTELQSVDQAWQWNRWLHSRQLTLDWSAVERVSEPALQALLEGLDLVEHRLELGAHTLEGKPALAARVSAIVERVDPSSRSRGPEMSSGTRPSLFRVETRGETALPEAPGGGQTDDAAEGIEGAAPGGIERQERSQHHPRGRILDDDDPVSIRDGFHRLIEWDLLGPAGGEEEIVEESSIVDRYLVGALATPRERLEPEEQDSPVPSEDGAPGGDEDGRDDDGRPAKPALLPSSMGLSFCVGEDVDDLVVEVECGYYDRVPRESEGDDPSPGLVWQRRPIRLEEPVPLGALRPGAIERRELWSDGPRRADLEGLVASVGGGHVVVTLFLVNSGDDERRGAAKRGSNWIFQPRVRVRAADGRSVFARRSLGGATTSSDPELATLAMQYRDRVEFATGHGVAADWELDEADPRRARAVWTEFLPTHEIPTVGQAGPENDPLLQGLCLDMQRLAEAADGELTGLLEALPQAYAAWIDRQRARVAASEDGLAGHEAEATRALEECARACERIREGIELLGSDPAAARAFRFANRAMALQRVRSQVARVRREGGDVDAEALDVPKNRSWRTFQLAFLLLNLPTATRLDHEERSAPTEAVADLLFFPTGGGKTEAYLGLAAYVLGLRRLQGVVADRDGQFGVAVIMRYTLRLLTLQQFQRASALVCACEVLRRRDPATWGEEPFRIGLWVGMGSTPNRTDDAAEVLKELRGTQAGRRRSQGGRIGGSGTPVQLRSCPWCGSEIDPAKNMEVESFASGRGRTLIFCSNYREPCPFSEHASDREGIPAVVVDEELYRLLPAFLIATVDKFAQMPWNGAVQALFGRVTHRCARHGFAGPEFPDTDHAKRGARPATKLEEHRWLRPPDLIIQDELHLISGPLGTMTALYETAVDELCSWEVNGRRVRPKVIASTATVRQAEEQVWRLFQRRLRTFPPPGPDIGDNFFSFEVPLDERPGRRYLGICATGKRQRKAQIQAYVTLLTAAQKLRDLVGEDDPRTDPYQTLVGYFISMRELAGMRRVVDDDIRSRARRSELARRGLGPRRIQHVEELTSRLPSARIPEVLERLETRVTDWHPQKSDKSVRRPYDVLLATNMISVGVDVERLGLMVAAGQPKATAEYIQATSRVGRRHPGLVVTIYNWARPRDLSHFERFRHYHATFYQQVEALSITPFATRALDRALAGLLIALVRLSGTRWNANGAAAEVTPTAEEVQRALAALSDRARQVSSTNDVGDLVEEWVKPLLDHWQHEQRQREGGAVLGYRVKRDGRTVGLLQRAGEGKWDKFTALNSLREVERTSPLALQRDVPLDGNDYQWTARPPKEDS